MTRTTTKLSFALIIAAAAFNALQSEPGNTTDTEPTVEVVKASDVNWGALNPARGDNSPRAANLWGDRAQVAATGFLVKFADGFSSPPHIHNVTYRGVVISGHVHNDDPEAEPMWMQSGSYWTQPAGESHITSARGAENMAYIEIQSGPYLVQPTADAFDSGEKAVNIDASNLVWLDAASIAWIEDAEDAAPQSGPMVAFLWGTPHDEHPSGVLVKLPGGFNGVVESSGKTLRAVIIQGRTTYAFKDNRGNETLDPGSYFGSTGETAHHVSCDADGGCVLYVRTEGPMHIRSLRGD